MSFDERRRIYMKKTNSSEYAFIFRPYITLKDGTRIYAWQHGKKAFCFAVPIDKVKE